MKNPKIFISYSYDNQQHADYALGFANKLRSDGIDATIDQYFECPPEGWPRWMDKQIRDADFVLTICTTPYYRRVMGDEKLGKGLGVRWEGHLIYQHIYQTGTLNNKFIPILVASSQISDIPAPLQSATRYDITKEDQYEKLYRRLCSQDSSSMPPLGNLRPLESKERKTDVALFVTGFINIELWNKAKWNATAFVHDEPLIEPPWLALCFENAEPAEKIFEDWHKRFGNVDEFNEMRVSIIEGDIPGENYGYTVHIGANIENIIKRADHDGIEIPKEKFLVISRLHRMNPRNSKNLDLFKQHYRRIGSYYLMPAMRKNGIIEPYPDLKILKRQIELRRVEDIKSKNDPDSVVLSNAK